MNFLHPAGLRLPLLLLLASSLPLLAQAESAPALDQETAVTSFDQVWEQVRSQYFDFERIAADWDQARATLRPLAAEAESLPALREVLDQLLAVIGESHFGVLPAELMNRLATLSEAAGADGSEERGPGRTGLRVRLIEDQVLVSEVSTDSPAWTAGIHSGWTLETINGQAIAAALADDATETDPRRRRQLVEFTLHGLLAYPDADRELLLGLVDHDGQTRELALKPDPLGVELVQLGQLPPMPFELELQQLNRGRHCVTALRFSTWVPEVTDALRQQREQWLACPALIIDLRGNPGGVMSTMVSLGADLFDETVVLGSLLRADGHIDFRVLPRRVAMDGTRLEPFAGPVAILVDSLSASTSEMFAAGMQASGRARLFGETSAGMALPAQMLRLASGDSLMYAFADYRDGAGRRIEGQGVQVDQAVPLSAGSLRADTSPPLQAALDWIAEQLGPAP